MPIRSSVLVLTAPPDIYEFCMGSISQLLGSVIVRLHVMCKKISCAQNLTLPLTDCIILNESLISFMSQLYYL